MIRVEIVHEELDSMQDNIHELPRVKEEVKRVKEQLKSLGWPEPTAEDKLSHLEQGPSTVLWYLGIP